MGILTKRERTFLKDKRKVKSNIRWNIERQIKNKFSSLADEDCVLAFGLLDSKDVNKIFGNLVLNIDLEYLNDFVKNHILDGINANKQFKKIKKYIKISDKNSLYILITKVREDRKFINNSRHNKNLLDYMRKQNRALQIKELLKQFQYYRVESFYERGIIIPETMSFAKWKKAILVKHGKNVRKYKYRKFPFKLRKKDKDIKVKLHPLYLKKN